jgi:hypothetical protein
MSISSTTNRISYVGTDLVSAYSYTFKIFNEDHIQVLVRKISDGTETVLTKTTDYTVSNVGNSTGGTVTLVNASQAWLTSGYLRSTYRIVFRLKPTLEQGTDIKNNNEYYAYLHERQFDKQFQISLSQQDEIDRSLKLPRTFVGGTDFTMDLPVGIIGQGNVYLKTNAAGTAFETISSMDDQAVQVTGSRSTPSNIVAGTGIAFTGAYYKNLWFIQGSGGAVTVSANPQIAAGTNVGQRLILIGRSDTNTLTLSDGTGLQLNGPITLIAGSILELIWDGTNWVEMYRNSI